MRNILQARDRQRMFVKMLKDWWKRSDIEVVVNNRKLHNLFLTPSHPSCLIVAQDVEASEDHTRLHEQRAA